MIIKILLHNRIFKFLYGVLLLPMCYVLFRTLMYTIVNIEFSNLSYAFLLGMALYLILHFLLYKPIKVYIIGHELVHAISTYICGGKVKNIKLNSNSGSVNVDKVNTFIALSPYFVPFYSIVVCIIWALLKYAFKLRVATELLLFFLGFTITFHIVLTLYAIYIGQQDFKISGWLFSIVLIFIINCLILIIIFIILLPSKLSFNEVKLFFLNFTVQVYKFCYEKFIYVIKLVALQIAKISQK